MTLFTKAQRNRLLKNGSPENCGKDHKPVVKLFLPGTAFTLLLTEINPADPQLAFGLCDCGVGFPELGYVDLNEVKALRVDNIYPVERDRYFKADHPLSVYTSAAKHYQAITTDEQELQVQGSFAF